MAFGIANARGPKWSRIERLKRQSQSNLFVPLSESSKSFLVSFEDARSWCGFISRGLRELPQSNPVIRCSAAFRKSHQIGHLKEKYALLFAEFPSISLSRMNLGHFGQFSERVGAQTRYEAIENIESTARAELHMSRRRETNVMAALKEQPIMRQTQKASTQRA
jgi:hypothetical protein